MGGQGLQQTLGVRMMAGEQQRAPVGPLHHPAAVHHEDLVGDLGDHAEVMGDEDDRGAERLLHAADQPEHLCLHGHVERGGGFVGDEQLRVQRHRHGDHHALAHPAGELVRVIAYPLLRLRNPDQPKQFHRPLPGLAFAYLVVVQPDHLDDLPADPIARVQAGQRILEDQADPGAADGPHLRGTGGQHVPALEQCPAADPRTLGQPHDGLGRDALAGARLTDDAEGLPGIDAIGDSPHGLHDAVRRTERHVQVIDLKQSHAASLSPITGRSAARLAEPDVRRVEVQERDHVHGVVYVRCVLGEL